MGVSLFVGRGGLVWVVVGSTRSSRVGGGVLFCELLAGVASGGWLVSPSSGMDRGVHDAGHQWRDYWVRLLWWGCRNREEVIGQGSAIANVEGGICER